MFGRLIKINDVDKIKRTFTKRYKLDGSGTRKFECRVLIENVGELEMIPVIRELKNKDCGYWPEKEMVKKILIQKTGEYIIAENIEAVVCPSSKSNLLKETMCGVKDTFPQLEKLVVVFPFKKNLEREIKLNEYQLQSPSGDNQTEKNAVEAKKILRRLSSSNLEASTSSIGMVGCRRYFYNFYGIENEDVFDQIKGLKCLFLDDSRGEWNTIVDCVPMVESRSGNSVNVLVFALDRDENKRENKQKQENKTNMRYRIPDFDVDGLKELSEMLKELDGLNIRAKELEERVDRKINENELFLKWFSEKVKPTNVVRKNVVPRNPPINSFCLKSLERSEITVREVMDEYEKQSGIKPKYETVYQFLVKNGWKVSGKNGVFIKKDSVLEIQMLELVDNTKSNVVSTHQNQFQPTTQLHDDDNR